MFDEFRYWRLCAWSGPLFLLIFIVFWGLMGFNIPPFSGSLPAAEIAKNFRIHADLDRTGMAISMSFAVLYAIWSIVIGKVMERVVGENNILVTLEIWGGGLTVVPVLVSCSFWLTGGYRPEALPAPVLQMLYDMAWLLIDMSYSVTSLQMFAMGIAFLSDRRARPLFPKWVSWYGIWVGAMFFLEILMPFFKNGPFARQGILNFWIEFLIWFFWIVVVSMAIFAAIGRLRREAREPQAHRRTA